MNGMEKKRRSRTRRDQPAADRPNQPYKKSYHQKRTNSSTVRSTPLDPPGHSPSWYKDTLRVSKTEAFSSYFDPLPSRTPLDEHILLCSSTPQSSPSSPSHPRSPSSPGLRYLCPSRTYLPVPTPTFDHIQPQPTPDSISPSSPGCREPQCSSHELPGDLRFQHRTSQILPADGLRLGRTQFNNTYGPNHPGWNEYDGQQGRTELPTHLHSSALYPPAPSGFVPRLAHRPEQTTTTSPPPASHCSGTPTAGNHSDAYFYPGYQDRIVDTSLPGTHLLAGRSLSVDPSVTFVYHS